MTVGCFDVRDGHCIARRRVHDDEINDIAVSPDGRLLATVSDDRTVRLLDIDLRCRTVLEGHDALVFRALFLRASDLLVTCDHAGGIFLWDLNQGRPIKIFYDYGRRNDLQIMGVDTGEEGNLLASANVDGLVMIRRISDGRLLTRLNAQERLFSVALCEMRGLIAAGAGEGKVFLWQSIRKAEF
jgi:WD40 repeat protein